MSHADAGDRTGKLTPLPWGAALFWKWPCRESGLQRQGDKSSAFRGACATGEASVVARRRAPLLTVGNVRFLFFLVHVPFAHGPSTVAAVAVRAEEVASVLRPPHALQLLSCRRGGKKKMHIQVSRYLVVPIPSTRSGFCAVLERLTCVAGMCWRAHCFSKSQMTMRPRP